MNRKIEIAAYIVILVFTALMIGSFPILASDVITIVGEVNDANQIVADGEIYEVDDTPQGDDLVKNYISQRVKVTGKLRTEDDMRIIVVTAFEVVEE
ncbi:MAG: hypothetical protein PVJ22_11400 [Desulfobacterales bacterium]|jgi:hypothetical protein